MNKLEQEFKDEMERRATWSDTEEDGCPTDWGGYIMLGGVALFVAYIVVHLVISL